MSLCWVSYRREVCRLLLSCCIALPSQFVDERKAVQSVHVGREAGPGEPGLEVMST